MCFFCTSWKRVIVFSRFYLMMCRVKTDSLLKVFLKILSDFLPGVRTRLPEMIAERMCLVITICSNPMNHINDYSKWKCVVPARYSSSVFPKFLFYVCFFGDLRKNPTEIESLRHHAKGYWWALGHFGWRERRTLSFRMVRGLGGSAPIQKGRGGGRSKLDYCKFVSHHFQLYIYIFIHTCNIYCIYNCKYTCKFILE